MISLFLGDVLTTLQDGRGLIQIGCQYKSNAVEFFLKMHNVLSGDNDEKLEDRRRSNVRLDENNAII
jgi:hypothetical protein